jgi:hypothetical protein
MTTTCYGGPDSLCEDRGIIPFTLPDNYKVLLCGLHYFQHKANDRRCESQFLIDIDEDGNEIRERCESQWRYLYITSENDLKRLCGSCYGFTQMCVRADGQSAQPEEPDEAAIKREYDIALREGGYYICFPEKEQGGAA